MVRISHFATPLASGSDDWREVAVIKHSCGPSEQCSNSHMAGRDAKAKEMAVLFEQRAVSDGSEMHVFWKLKCLLIGSAHPQFGRSSGLIRGGAWGGALQPQLCLLFLSRFLAGHMVVCDGNLSLID